MERLRNSDDVNVLYDSGNSIAFTYRDNVLFQVELKPDNRLYLKLGIVRNERRKTGCFRTGFRWLLEQVDACKLAAYGYACLLGSWCVDKLFERETWNGKWGQDYVHGSCIYSIGSTYQNKAWADYLCHAYMFNIVDTYNHDYEIERKPR